MVNVEGMEEEEEEAEEEEKAEGEEKAVENGVVAWSLVSLTLTHVPLSGEAEPI